MLKINYNNTYIKDENLQKVNSEQFLKQAVQVFLLWTTNFYVIGNEGLFKNPPRPNHFLTVQFINIDSFQPNVSFPYPLKTSENHGFLTFSGRIEMDHWAKMS